MSVLRLDNVSYSYGENVVLNQLSLDFEKGKMYAVVGKSGAGKTTLLSLLACLARPDSGEMYYLGQDVKKIDTYKYRSKYVGVIFQSYNLLTKLTALENVVLSMDIAEMKKVDKSAEAMRLLRSVGISEQEANRRVLQLSGGQQQRVAIARALAYNPDVILADEPTGNLDGQTEKEILGIMRRLADEGRCVILVTHSPAVSKATDIVIKL
ncbi:putative ABC transport system ATP-binding protein [Lachnospiraceae bacterium PF1-21]|uniref:ABC transporter ATP-binding protein n=1 Tax=Ohessyouella blattaphilus TaxID=2949333 RepID=A0ABT1EDR9_9FIRM|nr:ABC transporter ATP-binding protein [Ohessyouella blattaphilus]MCP1108854.1 ABC transporter ATP-binding protein [Ohessyouella blattaphilus]MCR8562248.1 ABC transporter ATP-binding protein [Ohessyouella blattaphilus]MDL2249095.1 ABC transporter ATP-binding protein [Lachnospiraceae bacterium OttesenSCG-928-J05]